MNVRARQRKKLLAAVASKYNGIEHTFDHVARTLSRVVPGVDIDAGYRFADRIHNSGQAVVWSGPREPAELYWDQLKSAGLTMAPLEQH